MLWNAYQQPRIDSAERTAESAEAKAESLARKVDELQRHIERLSLGCQALWELLRERSDITEDELQTKILEIDARDGAVDGKLGILPVDCPSCGRKTNTRRDTCIWCGAPVKRPYPFAV